jgi:hypothetical protein
VGSTDIGAKGFRLIILTVGIGLISGRAGIFGDNPAIRFGTTGKDVSVPDNDLGA